MKTVLITGASGYLAGALVPAAARRARVIGTARDAARVVAPAEALALDLADRTAVLDAVAQVQPDAIIHAAACNPGDGSGAVMQRSNVMASRHVAEAAVRIGARLVAVSTDTLFDGTAGPYADDAPASPLAANAYAVTKAAGEAAIMQLCPHALIVRTSLIYGLDRLDRGTAGFQARLKRGEPLKLFTDVLRQPVFDKALADGLTTLALDHANESGHMNLAGDEAMSRHAFACHMLDHWNIDAAGQVVAASGQGIAGLPPDCRLSLSRAHALQLATPGVTAVLTETR